MPTHIISRIVIHVNTESAIRGSYVTHIMCKNIKTLFATSSYSHNCTSSYHSDRSSENLEKHKSMRLDLAQVAKPSEIRIPPQDQASQTHSRVLLRLIGAQ